MTGACMDTLDDPFEVVLVEPDADLFTELSRKPVAFGQPAPQYGAATARLHGFDLDDRALVVDLPGLPGEIMAARSTVRLRREHTGAAVVVLFDQGDVRRPIITGVIQEHRPSQQNPADEPGVVSVARDDDRVVLSAEREIVLRCGDASITLTRAGKVLISGAYILSRSTGYNRIKGAAVDIN